MTTNTHATHSSSTVAVFGALALLWGACSVGTTSDNDSFGTAPTVGSGATNPSGTSTASTSTSDTDDSVTASDGGSEAGSGGGSATTSSGGTTASTSPTTSATNGGSTSTTDPTTDPTTSATAGGSTSGSATGGDQPDSGMYADCSAGVQACTTPSCLRLGSGGGAACTEDSGCAEGEACFGDPGSCGEISVAFCTGPCTDPATDCAPSPGDTVPICAGDICALGCDTGTCPTGMTCRNVDSGMGANMICG